MKRLALVTAALVAAVTVSAVLLLPPARVALGPPSDGDGTILGILHVHTSQSDGRSAPDVIAAAAARAGLKFVVFTDHGDGTNAPVPPVYLDGVLCIDAVEISTSGGHYLALGMPAAPYPLGGEGRDVVEDVARLGGFGIVAHPDSPKEELRWRDWDAPFDGLEVVNLDTSWRVLAARGWLSRLRLAKGLLTYPFRRSETIANLIVDSPELFSRWTALARTRPIVATAGADAHARLDWRDVDQTGRVSLPVPSYEATFRSMSAHVVPLSPLKGDARADAESIIGGIRRGHLYTAIDGLAAPPWFNLTIEDEQGHVAREGDRIAAGGPMRLRVATNAVGRQFKITVWKNEAILASGVAGNMLVVIPGEAGVYRADVRADSSNQLWIASNPIYVGDRPPALAPPVVTESQPLLDHRVYVETDGTSQGSVEAVTTAEGHELRLQYTLSAAENSPAYVAAVIEVPEGAAGKNRISVTARTDGPARPAIQFRTVTAGPPERRWGRSMYLDATDRQRTLNLSEFRLVGSTGQLTLSAGDIRHVLIVVDRTNMKAGARGTIWIKSAAFER